jgi:4-diphosphocytidyl-2-C-methyl-D-erythritol kinase
MKQLQLLSPAKVNLCLRIVGRRSNGYHNLVSVFHRISLADTLTISKRPSGFLFSSNVDLPPREGNLLFKAYTELQKEFPNLGGVRARLVKRIPIGAGLGGGSSNAAFFMLGMKKLYRLKISEARMLQVGLRIGADVPFFLKNKPQMLVQGIGERLKPLPAKKKKWFLLVADPRPLSTVAVYRHYRETKVPFSKKPFRPDVWVNDLQPSATAMRPSIAKTIQSLIRAGAETVLMSGSGPTVFAVLDSRFAAEKLRKALPGQLKKRAILCRSA